MRSMNPQQTLGTDLDGTLIPLPGNDQNRADLVELGQLLLEHRVQLLYVTGRHYIAVAAAITEFHLPPPDWIICDVGTTILRRADHTEFVQLQPYIEHQRRIVAEMPLAELRALLAPIDGLRLQEEEKQGPFKLSYYADAARLGELVEQLGTVLHTCQAPYSVIHSVDPFNGDGLVDLLPRGISKAYALTWWSSHTRHDPESIVFAGDSGNDLAAMIAGFRTIVVGNASPQVVDHAAAAHRSRGWTDRLYLAEQPATSGVLEGCRFWGLIPRNQQRSSH